MNRNKEFVKNTIILLIGKFATQFMSLLLLPLYTHYLLTDDYGTVDLLQTYISLFIPIFTLRIDSGVFRFLLDKRQDENGKKKIITNTLFILAVGISITVILLCIVTIFVEIKYSLYVIINLIILMFSSVLLQILRGLGKNKEYSIVCIIIALITLIANLVLILGIKKGAESILISSSVANIIGIIYISIKIKLFKYIKLSFINKEFVKDILKYSIPMVPNALSWWIVNSSSRTIISIFLGTAYNGIYTVSCKFSNILNSIYSIFNMSWQETASLHINDKDKDEFFTNMINRLFMLFATMTILIVAILPFLYDKVIGNEYISSYRYIPILLYANLWNILLGLIGGIYVANKKTKEIANTTIISAIINIIINIGLVKLLGLYAACISSLVSYITMSIYRYIDCRKYVNFKFNINNLIVFTILFIISSATYLYNNGIVNIVNLIAISIYSVFINRTILKKGIEILKQKIHFNIT